MLRMRPFAERSFELHAPRHRLMPGELALLTPQHALSAVGGHPIALEAAATGLGRQPLRSPHAESSRSHGHGLPLPLVCRLEHHAHH